MITNEYLSWRRGRSARVVQLTDEVLEGRAQVLRRVWDAIGPVTTIADGRRRLDRLIDAYNLDRSGPFTSGFETNQDGISLPGSEVVVVRHIPVQCDWGRVSPYTHSVFCAAYATVTVAKSRQEDLGQ